MVGAVPLTISVPKRLMSGHKTVIHTVGRYMMSLLIGIRAVVLSTVYIDKPYSSFIIF